MPNEIAPLTDEELEEQLNWLAIRGGYPYRVDLIRATIDADRETIQQQENAAQTMLKGLIFARNCARGAEVARDADRERMARVVQNNEGLYAAVLMGSKYQGRLRERIRRLKWLVGEKDKGLDVADAYWRSEDDDTVPMLIGAGEKVRDARALTVDDASEERTTAIEEIIAEKRPWPGYCQACKAPLDPPNRTSCLSCGASDTDE